jgi:2-methylcitrate dehydratase PrpD
VSTRDFEAERLARLPVEAAFHLHQELGPDLLDSVYAATFREGVRCVADEREP